MMDDMETNIKIYAEKKRCRQEQNDMKNWKRENICDCIKKPIRFDLSGEINVPLLGIDAVLSISVPKHVQALSSHINNELSLYT
uniref:Uncharacterized protein n=1 Tax=Arion vulgaris TaxID=1028688 RepID=A0A0B7BME3_9EUPU